MAPPGHTRIQNLWTKFDPQGLASEDEDEEEIPETEEVSDQGPKAGGALDRDKSAARGGGAIPLKPEDRSAPEGSVTDHLTLSQQYEVAAASAELGGDEPRLRQVQEGLHAWQAEAAFFETGVRFNPVVGIAEDIQQGKWAKASLEIGLTFVPGDEYLKAASGVAKGLRGAKGGTTPLWRAVKPEELADIQGRGIFRNLSSAEGKYFSRTAEGAASYAKQAVKGFGDPPYTLIRTDVPNNLVPRPLTVDRNVPAVVFPNNVLPTLKPQVLDYFPVPPP